MFLLMLLTRPSSMVSRYLFNNVSLTRAANPWAGSVRIKAGGPSSGRRPIQIWMRESHKMSFVDDEACYRVRCYALA